MSNPKVDSTVKELQLILPILSIAGDLACFASGIPTAKQVINGQAEYPVTTEQQQRILVASMLVAVKEAKANEETLHYVGDNVIRLLLDNCSEEHIVVAMHILLTLFGLNLVPSRLATFDELVSKHSTLLADEEVAEKVKSILFEGKKIPVA